MVNDIFLSQLMNNLNILWFIGKPWIITTEGEKLSDNFRTDKCHGVVLYH